MRATQSRLNLAWLAGVLVTWLATPPPAPASSPFATQIISAQGPFGSGPYGETNAVLGASATWFYDPFGAFSGGTTNRRVKLVEAAFNIAPSNTNLITPNLVLTLGNGSRIITRFDHPIYDNPANPYGIDLLVFGNAFYASTGPVHDGANMNTVTLTGGVFAEPLKVSVSPGYTGQPGESPTDPDTWPWYRYDNGPYGDTGFPTQAYKWNRAGASWLDETNDFTKPVNPVLQTMLETGGLSAADGIDLYVGSGGGSGFDLQASGFAWIQYVKVEGIDPGFSQGEIDAVAAVRPMIVGDALSIAPENLTNNTGTLIFQQSGQTNRSVALAFSSVSAVAKVSTAILTNPASLGPLTGVPLNAVQLSLGPVLGNQTVSYQSSVALAAGENYNGNGSDLLVFKWNGASWDSQAFSFDSTNRAAVVSNVTDLSAFVVTQLVPPQLTIRRGPNRFLIQFTPLSGWSHTLQRSTNFVAWTPLMTFTATNAQPVVIEDNSPPATKAFYRVKAQKP